MKRKFLMVILVLLGSISVFAGEKVLELLRAESNGKAITVSWKAVDELGVSVYSVERAGDDLMFEEIATENPKGIGTTYRYIDETAFKDVDGNEKTQTNNTYYYRIVLKKSDNTKIISDKTTVTHNTSGIRRTWGMLKEMFR